MDIVLMAIFLMSASTKAKDSQQQKFKETSTHLETDLGSKYLKKGA
jgi:hypothetical protein